LKFWNSYAGLIKRNCASNGTVKDLAYWRNSLFAGTIIYMLPFSFIALIPGLYWIFVTGQYTVAVVDLLAVAGMAVVAFVPGISQPRRKIIFLSCMYTFSFALLYYVGLSGPGLVYLLAASIFSILIIPTKYKFWPAWLNTFICLLFTIAILFRIIPWSRASSHLTGEWIAVSTNLIFLSFLSAALIPGLFNGLQETLMSENQLKDDLSKQQRSLEQALSKLNQKNVELEQFAYVASHDLKEPLRMVVSFMGLLKNKYVNDLDEKAHTYIDFAIDGGKRMQRMITDLLELSRTGRKDMVKEDVNLNEVLQNAQQDILKLIEENRAEILINPSLPVLVAYKADMSRLFQNLLSNAIKFRKKDINPVIKVAAFEKPNEWVFSIEDNGIGIESENFEKIFDVFTRLHSQQAYEGSGIGLAVCKKVVEYYNGKIWVESGNVSGSVFYFTIKK
jgi:signal transduction histidine kinase